MLFCLEHQKHINGHMQGAPHSFCMHPKRLSSGGVLMAIRTAWYESNGTGPPEEWQAGQKMNLLPPLKNTHD